MAFTIKKLGHIAYDKALNIQQQTFIEVSNGKQDCLIFCEHPHVFTLGKSANKNNLLIDQDILDTIQATSYQIDRGGDITYHGPGQLVCYPIINLRKIKIGVKKYVQIIEHGIINTLDDYGIKAYQIDNLTGIWVGKEPEIPRKIGAIGIRIKQGISMHGFALNIDTDLDYFRHINPCGITDKKVTSMMNENVHCTIDEFSDLFLSHFEKSWSRETL